MNMEQTVYIDLFFLINFSMDFLGLFLAAKLLGRSKRIFRLVLAAVFGGFYACFTLIVPLENYLSVFSVAIDALVCFIMSFIATFERRVKRGVFSFALVFGATSILLGGAMTALFYVFNRLGLDRAFAGENEQSDGLSVYIFAVFAAISGITALFGGRFLKKKAIRQNGVVEIKYRAGSVKLACICDSGNLLREPISQLPCILIELEALKSVISRELYEAARKGDFNKIPQSESSRIRLIPTQSVSGQALLIGFRPDGVLLDMGKGRTRVDAYVVFSIEKISACGVSALVPSELAVGAA